MIAINGGRIITMDQAGEIARGTILIDGAFIQAVGADIEIPPGCQVINAGGKVITPGFIDAHTHIGLEEEIYRVEGDDVNEINEPVVPELQAVDGINFDDLAFRDALKGGVTRSLSMPGSANIIGGQAVFLKHLASTAMEMICQPCVGLKAALGENPKRVYGERKKSPVTRMANASMLRETFFTASRLMEKEDVKPQEMYRYAAVIKVLRNEIPLLLHAHRADDILTALRIKDEFNIELMIQHGTEAFKVADELVRRDVPVFLGPLLVNRAKVEMKEVSFAAARLLAEQGVKFCFITDHPVIPIEHLRTCAALAVREGLDENLALQAITCKPAAFLKISSALGSLVPGKRADLVIFDGHPFEFRSRVSQVMVDGILWSD